MLRQGADPPIGQVEIGEVGFHQARFIHGRHHNCLTNPLALRQIEKATRVEAALHYNFACDLDSQHEYQHDTRYMRCRNRQYHCLAILEPQVIL